MLMDARPPALAQAIAAYDAVGGNIVVVEPAAPGEAHKYGIATTTDIRATFAAACGCDLTAFYTQWLDTPQ